MFFELNGQPREVLVHGPVARRRRCKPRPKAEPGNPQHVGRADARPGGRASPSRPARRSPPGRSCCTLEAMKMETTVYAERAGKVAEVLVRPGTQVEGGDLLIRFE